MIQVNEIAFSCYAVSNMPRARGFYEGVLGLKPAKVTDTAYGSWVEYELGAGTLSLGSAPGFKPSPDGCMVALEVENFDAAVNHLKANGITLRMEPVSTPVCRMVMVFDPDGNSICIHKRNAS